MGGRYVLGLVGLVFAQQAQAVCTVNTWTDNVAAPTAGQLRYCVDVSADPIIEVDDAVLGISLLGKLEVDRSVQIRGRGAWIYQDINESPGFSELIRVSGTGLTVSFDQFLFLGYGDPRALRIDGTNNTVTVSSSEISLFGSYAVTLPDAAVSVASTNTFRTSYTNFYDNVGARSGAVFANNGTVDLVGGRFEGNIGPEAGVLTGFGGSTVFEIEAATFAYNGPAASGAVDVGGSIEATILTSTFLGNVGTSAGAIHCHFCDELTIDNSTFDNNSSPLGGGVRASDADVVEITDSTFVRNRADIGGGAIHFERSVLPFEIERCTLYDNGILSSATPSHFGGALLVEDSEGLVLNTNFANNGALWGTSNTSGGNVAILTNSDVELRHVTMTNGTASSAGNLAVFSATVDILNSIVATPKAGGNCSIGGTLTATTSIASDLTCSLPAGNLIGDPKLLANGNYGFPLWGRPPQSKLSLPVNRATLALCPADDLNGQLRPKGTGCDIGAVEAY